jgi:hypothetical protein
LRCDTSCAYSAYALRNKPWCWRQHVCCTKHHYSFL